MDNGGYIAAAYLLAAACFLLYGVFLRRRVRHLREETEALTSSRSRGGRR